MQTYTIIGYKPHSVDTCRNCVMAEYDSDFRVERRLDADSAAAILAALRAYERKQGETGYEIYVFEDGPEAEDGMEPDVPEEIEEAAKPKIASIKAAQAIANERAEQKRRDAERARDEQQLRYYAKRLAEQ